MRADLRYATGLALAGLAAVWWAVGVTELQPLTEPLGPWSERLLGGHPYWARELRLSTIFLAVLALVLAAGGDHRWTRAAVPLGGVWVVADIAVDRVDPQGVPATVLLVAVAWAGIALVVLLLGRRWGRPGAVGGWRERRSLTGAACVAAALLATAASLTAPTGREQTLDPAAYVTGVLALGLTLGCALAAAPGAGRARTGIAAGAGVVALVLLWLARTRVYDPSGVQFGQGEASDRPLIAVLLGVVALTALPLVAWDWPGGRPHWRRHLLAAVGVLLGLPAVALLAGVAVSGLRLGALATALAGNVVVSGPDGTGDVLFSVVGLLTGLVMALLLAWPNALGYRRPAATAAPAGPTGPPPPTDAGLG
ncbi:hypothetical protein [Micromonospora siamensis]|uniref:Uncharacterized protein n=1 Tax=Micromonospora siamensis TaxID=299152 RepID=A0A1C5HI54_9ACTN|nr:hypothetical protein [Micromonospora siamensis]SCG45702.1 hypothetical protein GA0074704_1779 [Micromonospora siamensis]